MPADRVRRYVPAQGVISPHTYEEVTKALPRALVVDHDQEVSILERPHVVSSWQKGQGTVSQSREWNVFGSAGSPPPQVHRGSRFSSHSSASQPVPWQGQPSRSASVNSKFSFTSSALRARRWPTSLSLW